MFINDVKKKEEIRTIAVRHLRKYSIKFRYKTPRQSVQLKVVKSRKLFNVPLQNLENETVTLKNGQQLVIPKRLYEMCSHILSQVEVEGVFRKEGSKSRQNEIKLSLDRGCMLGDDHHIIDVAVVLKCFLRQLPEPLIPYTFHELFLRCSLTEHKVEALLLACLLIPTENLNVLCYLMQFLHEVASFAKYNKMTPYNLAVVLTPNIFPINEKVAPKNRLMVKKTCDIVKLMIENAKNIGLIPEYIIEQIASPKNGNQAKSKRRRSGSLTRIFNGLKKMVGNKMDEDSVSLHTVTPDMLLAPSLSEIPKKNSGHETVTSQIINTKNGLEGKRTMLERRWSAITSATNFKRKKRESFIYKPNEDSLDSLRADYVRVPKTEYEEIKNRVSLIEKRLSLELDNVHATVVHNEVNIIQDIQSAYEHTLEQAEQLSPGTDVIARRLSRELKIRNSDQKMIRSPSARKIGTIRRRSRELEKPAIVINPAVQIPKELRQNCLPRSISSPIRNNISVNTNMFGSTVNFNSSTHISLNVPGNSVQFTSNIGYNPRTSVTRSPSHKSPRGRCKLLRHGTNSTSPKYGHLRERHCNLDGHRFIEITGVSENDKENGGFTPTAVPHIKKAIPLARTPKRMCGTPKHGRVVTPLRVLPSGAARNVLNF